MLEWKGRGNPVLFALTIFGNGVSELGNAGSKNGIQIAMQFIMERRCRCPARNMNIFNYLFCSFLPLEKLS